MKKNLLFIGLVLSLTINAQISTNIEWQKALGGTNLDFSRSIQQTTDGGYIVAGATKSNDGDVYGNHGGSDFWVVKLASTGTIQWQKTLGGTNFEFAYSIQQTTDGGYILAGNTNSNDGDVFGLHGGASDAWVVKLSAMGVIQWQKALGGTDYDGGSSIRQTTDGGYVMAGNTNSNNGDVAGYHGDGDAWVVKLSATGEIQWQKALGGASYDSAYSIQQTTDDGYIMAGFSNSNDGDASGNQGFTDAWIVKLSATGVIQWQKSLGGSDTEIAWSIQQTTDGGYILAGDTNSNDGDVFGLHGVDYDAWVVKLSATGVIQWQKVLGGTSSETAFSIQQTADGGYIMTGETWSNDGDVAGNHGGGNDSWVVKLSSEQLSTSDFYKTNLKLYPNPANSLINIQTYNNTRLDKISITDLTGKTVLEQIQNTNQVSVEKLATGVYILNGYSEGNKFQEKFIKE